MTYHKPRFKVERERDLCIDCGVCVRQCANEVHIIDRDTEEVFCNSIDCINCQRCVELCPTGALAVRRTPQEESGNAAWSTQDIRAIQAQAQNRRNPIDRDGQ